MFPKGLSHNYEGGAKANEWAFNNSVNFSGVEFAFTIAITTTTAKQICICPAYFDTLQVKSNTASLAAANIAETISYDNKTAINASQLLGFDVDGVLSDGTIFSNCTVTAVRGKVRDFLNFVKFNPVKIKAIIIDADDTTQFDQSITIAKATPFRQPEVNTKYLGDYYNPYQNLTTKIEVPTPGLQFDNQTLVSLGTGYKSSGATTITVRLKIEDVLNIPGAFANA
jgi:hypothetical protein